MTNGMTDPGLGPGVSYQPCGWTAPLTGLGRMLAAEQWELATARRAVLDGALRALPEMRWASLTSTVHRQPTTLAATADPAELADALQYRTGVGPCLQALAEEAVVHTADLAAERRWTPFVAATLADTPVRAVVSCSLAGGGLRQLSLNLYAAEPLTGGSPDTAMVATVAAASAIALTAIDQRYRADHLEQALASSRRIGAAMGILMASQRLTEQQAFDALRTVSQHSHRKLREVAEEVLLTGELPTVTLPQRTVRVARPERSGRGAMDRVS